jgi:hypothetical protein
VLSLSAHEFYPYLRIFVIINHLSFEHTGAVDIAELQKSVEDLKFRERLRGDKRLFYFGAAAPSSSGKHSMADHLINTYYTRKCVLCGDEGATRAHLVSGSRSTTYPEFNTPNYCNDLDVKSIRNFIPLCGNKGAHGTCHDAFDTFRLTILFNPFECYHYCYCLDRGFSKYDVVHKKIVRFHSDHKPYGRLLAWHARKCTVEHSYWVQGEDIPLLLCAVDLSETKSVGQGSSASSSSASV